MRAFNRVHWKNGISHCEIRMMEIRWSGLRNPNSHLNEPHPLNTPIHNPAFVLMYVYAGFELAGCKYTSVKRSIVNDSCHPDDYVDRLNLNVDSNRKQNQTNNNRKCERSKETATTKKCYQFYLFQIASCKWHRKKAYPHESPKQIVDAEPFCECACNFFYGRIKLNGWKHHSSKSK